MSLTDSRSSRRYRFADLKRLFALSYNECALPSCEIRLADVEWDKVLGEICHIYGLNPGSARYVSGMTSEELNSFENLLILCCNCHKRVDELEPEAYPAERLLEIKRQHSERRTNDTAWCDAKVLEHHVRTLASTYGLVVIGLPSEPSPAQPQSSMPPRRGGKKIRAYELARELGLTNKEALDLCIALGIGVKSHSSSIDDAQADRVRRKADAEGLRREVSPPEPVLVKSETNQATGASSSTSEGSRAGPKKRRRRR